MTDITASIEKLDAMLSPSFHSHERLKAIAECVDAEALPALKAAQARIKALEEVVGKCQTQFAWYASNHKAKGTPDGDSKAVTNQEFADLCAATLTGEG